MSELKQHAGLAATGLEAADIKSNLVTEALLIGEGGRLPKNCCWWRRNWRRWWCSQRSADWLAFSQHGDQAALEARAKSAGGDADALNLLCWWKARTRGWRSLTSMVERYGEERFAVSYLEGIKQAKKLSFNDAERSGR